MPFRNWSAFSPQMNSDWIFNVHRLHTEPNTSYFLTRFNNRLTLHFFFWLIEDLLFEIKLVGLWHCVRVFYVDCGNSRNVGILFFFIFKNVSPWRKAMANTCVFFFHPPTDRCKLATIFHQIDSCVFPDCALSHLFFSKQRFEYFPYPYSCHCDLGGGVFTKRTDRLSDVSSTPSEIWRIDRVDVWNPVI